MLKFPATGPDRALPACPPSLMGNQGPQASAGPHSPYSAIFIPIQSSES